ncbi:MAG: VanZ family protein [Rhodothermales bacterium]|jgi:VanZ family protein
MAVLWTLGILSAVFLPGSYIPEYELSSLDKVAHFVLFGGFAGLWMLALGDNLPRAALYIIVLGVSYGILTEVGQTLMDGGRHGDPLDAVADGVGVLVGVGAFLLWRRLHPEPSA